MISKAQIKWVRSLHQKKFREEEQAFLVEGEKTVGELMLYPQTFPIQSLYFCPLYRPQAQIFQKNNPQIPCLEISPQEMERLSTLQTPSPVLAVASLPVPQPFTPQPNGLYLVLDGVRDPGNMGTIIRLAHWFGIDALIASADSVEHTNPKTVQATMGALFRVPIYYTDLPTLLKDTTLPIYGTVLEEGRNIYRTPLTSHGLIVMGSESHGIRPNVLPYIQHRITIPSYVPGTESLNVAVACAITCARFRQDALAAQK